MNSKSSLMASDALYFSKLYLENVKCFRGKHELDLSDGADRPARWTVILGNNNMGKTTVLRALADLEPMKSTPINSKDDPSKPMLKSSGKKSEENLIVPYGISRYPSASDAERLSSYSLSANHLKRERWNRDLRTLFSIRAVLYEMRNDEFKEL